MMHNERYWEASGSHIQLMLNLSEILASITNTSLSEDLTDKKEDLKDALSIIFTIDMHSYKVCPGGHADKIREAKDKLAISPEDVLLSNWHGYIKSLMRVDVELSPGANTPIINAIAIGEQVHFPPAIDYLSGVSKEIIIQKDIHMLNGLNGLEIEHLSFLINKVFDFPKHLFERLTNEIDDLLEGFDELDSGKKNDKVNQLCDTILGQYKEDIQDNGLKHDLWNMNLNDFDDVSTIKKKAKEYLCLLLSTITKIDEMTLERISELDVSVNKRIECIPKEAQFINPLFIVYALKGNSKDLDSITTDCPDVLKNNMFINALVKFAFNGNQAAFNTVADCSFLDDLKTKKNLFRYNV